MPADWLHVCFVCSQAAEQDFRREYQDKMKLEEKRYRSQRDEISKLPKAEQRNALKKLKQEHSHIVALHAEQFQNTVTDHLDQQNVSISAVFLLTHITPLFWVLF